MLNYVHPKRLLFVAIFLLAALSASAYDFEVDGIYYNKLSDTEVETTWKTYFGSGMIFEITDYVGDVVVPETVTYEGKTYKVTAIGESTFHLCFQVTSISLPKTITSIGARAFDGTRGLTEDIIIPQSVISIGTNAFSDSHIKSLVIPDGVSIIPYGICQATRTLRSVKLPDGATSIGCSAFLFCDSLETINIPSKVTSIGEDAFHGCEKIGAIELPDCLEKIEDGAFYYCENMTINNLPANLTYLGEYAFCGCYDLDAAITIPKGITEIKGGTFYKSGLKSVIIEGEVDSIGASAFNECRSMESINIPESVIYIGNLAFASCNALSCPIVIPKGVTAIGKGIFQGCNSIPSFTLHDGITSIGEGAFRGCCSVPSFTLPNGITSIGAGAFASCNSMTSFNIPASVTRIENETFQYCYAIESVSIPDCLTYIGEKAFYQCSNLTSIHIPANVTEIGISAFEYCNAKNIVIGKSNSDESNISQTRAEQSTMTIGGKAFYNSGIERISIYLTTAPICGEEVFSEYVLKNAKLYIPEGTSEEYSNANVWKEFFISGNASEEILSIIDNVTINSDTTVIGYYGIDGQRLAEPQRGINIVRYSNGNGVKVLCK